LPITRRIHCLLLPLFWISLPGSGRAETVTIDASPAGRDHPIDGFGVMSRSSDSQTDWWQQLLYDDLGASILRVDLTPALKAPYSDHVYNSPWFGNMPPITGGGPEGNYVRTYTSAADYTREFAGQRAQIAVMGPDIETNLLLFDFDAKRSDGLAARAGTDRRTALGDFKLYGSILSPLPWLKVSSGNHIGAGAPPLPAAGTPWPFIWGANFSGGLLDTSGTPLPELDDGAGPTSALTQFGRSLAAWLRGFQRTYGVHFYAISLQNELNFEEFYSSCSYPLAPRYIAALKAARAELDRYPDLADIRIIGPEDLLGGDPYGLWQYGSGQNVTHKNLQYLAAVAADDVAARALAMFNIHGYASDGITAGGGDPLQWRWWADGWTRSPAAGLPAAVQGFRAYGKPSWMTETSGEATDWLAPATGFPRTGAFSIALKIHQALTAGQESAWIYLSLSEPHPVGAETLTDGTQRQSSAKYTAAKHFFRYIRPGAWLLRTQVDGSSILASAYLHEAAGTLTVVLINQSASDTSATVVLPAAPTGLTLFDAYTSQSGHLWQASSLGVTDGRVEVPVPGYGVVTLTGSGMAAGGGAGGGAAGGGGAGGDAGSGAGGGQTGGGASGSPQDGLAGGCAMAGRPESPESALLCLIGLGLCLCLTASRLLRHRR
jgi:hypothetical protein